MELSNIEKFINDIEEKEREYMCTCANSEGLESADNSNTELELSKHTDILDKNVYHDSLSLLDDNNILISCTTENKPCIDVEKNCEGKNVVVTCVEKGETNAHLSNMHLQNCGHEDKHNIVNKSQSHKHTRKSKKNLDDIYNTIVQQKLNEQPEQKSPTDNYDLNYLVNNPEMTKPDNQNILFDELSSFVTKYLYEESIRGWNPKYDVLMLNQYVLDTNIKKIKWYSSHNALKIGYIYRNIDNPKIFADKDINTHWLMCGIDTSKSIISTFEIKELKPSDKILTYSLENLVTNKKYKKKIGSTMYKFIKIQTQFSTNRNMIMDIIFYIGLKSGSLTK